MMKLNGWNTRYDGDDDDGDDRAAGMRISPFIFHRYYLYLVMHLLILKEETCCSGYVTTDLLLVRDGGGGHTVNSGLEANEKTRNDIISSVNDTFKSFTPLVDTDCYDICFVPVVPQDDGGRWRRAVNFINVFVVWIRIKKSICLIGCEYHTNAFGEAYVRLNAAVRLAAIKSNDVLEHSLIMDR